MAPRDFGNRQILAGQPRQSLRRRRRRYRETRSADVRHAECALRHRRLARQHQDQRRGTHRSVHGSKRANSGHRRDRACRETGEVRARLPASGRHGSRGRDAGPGDDHPDDHPHRLEWPRRASDRIELATAADIGLTLNQPAPAPAPLTPPAANVPGNQHVFLFYFENEDYSQVIGNAKQAPYLNSLRRGGATLTNFYAEEHPSDANYLALAGGSAFGVPLTDPEEENPLYTIDAANIGDLIAGSGESWKAYLQSANGPCDDTVHGYYWNDDQPMMYFQDGRDRPRYCARHGVPLEELGSDLANPATTPNFAWVAPDDCADMEGCVIAAGDEFLKTELTAITNSPAWRTQRSLAITMAGQTAVVVEPYGYTVTLIDTKNGRVYSPVTVGSYPVAAAITG